MVKRIAFLHLAPVPGDWPGNITRLETAVATAIAHGADWVLTPELATSGYTFHVDFGVDWIGVEHDAALAKIVALAAEARVTVFLGMPERDEPTGALFNTLRVIDGDRGVIGAHRKINALRVGSEAWSSQGAAPTTVELHGFGPVGLLVCADACSPVLGGIMRERGVRAVVSAANWAPGEWGPAGEWERLSLEASAPVFNCNRTGTDTVLSFEPAESVIAYGGHRQLSLASATPSLIVTDWSFAESRLVHWFSEALQ